MPYAVTSTEQSEVPAVKSIVPPSPNKSKSKTQLGLLSRLFSTLSDLTKSKKPTITTVTPAPKREPAHYPTRQHSERRYGKTNRNNRSRVRRERGQQNYRHPSTSTNQITQYDQALQDLLLTKEER